MRGRTLVMGPEKRGMGRDSRANFEEDETTKRGIPTKSRPPKPVTMRQFPKKSRFRSSEVFQRQIAMQLNLSAAMQSYGKMENDPSFLRQAQSDGRYSLIFLCFESQLFIHILVPVSST